MSAPGRSQARFLRAKQEGGLMLAPGRSQARFLRAKQEGGLMLAPGRSGSAPLSRGDKANQ
jgi:hypothetical protein